MPVPLDAREPSALSVDAVLPKLYTSPALLVPVPSTSPLVARLLLDAYHPGRVELSVHVTEVPDDGWLLKFC